MTTATTFHGVHRISPGPLATAVVELLESRPWGRIAILVDGHLANHDSIRDTVEALGARRIATDMVSIDGGEPSLAAMPDLAARFSRPGDAILAVGGGSVLDSAKALSLLWTGETSLEAFEGAEQVTSDPTPVIAAPTTAGTGSEVTGSCVLLSSDGRRKISIRSQRLRPTNVVLDPHLLVGAPAQVIRAAGADALGHAIESYFSAWATPITRALSLAAVREISQHLPAFYDDPTSLNDAAATGWGACMAGIAFNSARVGLGHALAAVIAPVGGVPHGIAVGLALPHHIDHCAATGTTGWAALAEALGAGETREAQGRARARAAVLDLLAHVDVPRTLGAIGRQVSFSSDDAENVASSGRLDSHPGTVDSSLILDVLHQISASTAPTDAVEADG